jgi:serine/threonine protein phosphatase PrpC
VSDPQRALDVVPGPAVSFGFNLGKIPDHGEDSDPILRDGPDLGLAGVFDGMGGAGGTVYETADGPRSGAYLASRIARDVVERHLLTVLAPDRPLPGDTTASELHDALEAALREALADLNAPTSRLRSRLLRALPTTMALGALQRTKDAGNRWVCHVFWAGDSRVYAFTADGMHQLSIDDLRDPGDAMENLQRDSVVSNAISADTEFHINHRRVMLEAPFVLLSATDGCFGYLRSPMHFEEMVLRTLASADTDEEWSAALQAEIAEVTGDDAAMAAIGVGADLDSFKDLFAPRLAEVTEKYTGPLDRSLDELERAEQALVELRQRRAADISARWHRYSAGYERFLQAGLEPEGEPEEDRPERRIWNPPRRISTGPSAGSGPSVETASVASGVAASEDAASPGGSVANESVGEESL